MNQADLRAVQAPLKERYRQDPESAQITLRAEGDLGTGITCSVQTGRELVRAGLHPGTGGDGLAACSGDMLLQALVACAGVTMQSVSTSSGIALRGGTVRAEGDLDWRGTLAIDKEAPVGFKRIRLTFEVDADATPEELATLLRLTERYCVVLQTIRSAPEVVSSVRRLDL